MSTPLLALFQRDPVRAALAFADPQVAQRAGDCAQFVVAGVNAAKQQNAALVEQRADVLRMFAAQQIGLGDLHRGTHPRGHFD